MNLISQVPDWGEGEWYVNYCEQYKCLSSLLKRCFVIYHSVQNTFVVFLWYAWFYLVLLVICCFLCKFELKPQKKLCTLWVKYYSMSNRLINMKYFLVFVQKRLWFVFDLDFCNNFFHAVWVNLTFIKTEGHFNKALLPFMLVRSKNLMTQFLVTEWFLVGWTTKNKPQQTPQFDLFLYSH